MQQTTETAAMKRPKEQRQGQGQAATGLHAVWNWIAQVLEDSQDLKQSYSEKKCREYNVNVYTPLQIMSADDDGCLALEEHQKMDAAEDLLL